MSAVPYIFIDARTFWLKVSVSVSVSVQLGLAGQSPRRDSQALCLTSSGQVLVFLCDLLVSQQHISQLFVRAMAAAGLGLRKSGKSRAKSSTQGWSPNSGRAAEDESGSFVDVLVSEQGQHSSSSGLTLPQQQNQQAGSQTQSASSMDQLQNGLVQYRPSGTNPEPPTTDTLGEYQPPGIMRHHSQGKTSTLTPSSTLN